jgi:hypothetical protein
VKEGWKKRREEAHLQRFRENFADFPEGMIIPHEHPDFLMETYQGRIGIEHTEYVREPDEVRGSPMRAQERTEDRVLLTASRQHQSKGLPPVAVYVHWNPHQALGRHRIQELATALADLVKEHLPEISGNVAIRYGSHAAWRSLPREVTSLSVHRSERLSENFFVSTRGGFVPTVSSTELQRIVSDKEAKVPSYRQECQEVWLLIAAHGFEPSTHCELGSEVEGHEFETSFDRVFFLHHFDGVVTELRVRPNGLGAGSAAL